MKCSSSLRSAAPHAAPWIASLVIAAGCVGLGGDAHAQQASSAAPPAQGSLWTSWALWPALGAGVLGATIGAGIGAVAGGVLSVNLCGSSSTAAQVEGSMCYSEFVIGSSLGGWVGGSAGSAGAVTLLGKALDYPGSFNGAAGGGMIGMLVGGAVMIAPLVFDIDPKERLPYVLIGLIPPAIGATIGYSLGAPEPAPTSASLIRYSPAQGLELGAPAVGLSLRPHEEALTLSLLGGAF